MHGGESHATSTPGFLTDEGAEFDLMVTAGIVAAGSAGIPARCRSVDSTSVSAIASSAAGTTETREFGGQSCARLYTNCTLRLVRG